MWYSTICYRGALQLTQFLQNLPVCLHIKSGSGSVSAISEMNSSFCTQNHMQKSIWSKQHQILLYKTLTLVWTLIWMDTAQHFFWWSQACRVGCAHAQLMLLKLELNCGMPELPRVFEQSHTYESRFPVSDSPKGRIKLYLYQSLLVWIGT